MPYKAKPLLLPALLLLFVVSIPAPSQSETSVDSLLKAISIPEESVSRIEDLIFLGEHYKYLNPDSALSFYEDALLLSQNLDTLEFEALCLRCIAMVEEYQGAFDKALEKYFLALNSYEKAEDSINIARCFNDIAIIHYLQKSYEQSTEYLTKSYEIKKELGDSTGTANYYTNMAAVTSEQGLYERSIEYATKSIDLFTELGDMGGVATGYENVGSLNFKMGKYDVSKENHLKALVIFREIGHKEGMAHSLSNAANVSLVLADSVAKSEKTRVKYLEDVINYGNKSFQLAEELDAMYIKNFVAHALMVSYDKLGKYDRAMDFAYAFIQTRDSLYNEEKTRAIEEMDTKYETEKKQQQIELQKSQIIARDATIKQQKTFRNALISGLLAVLVIIVIVIYAYTQKRRDNEKIKDQNVQIKEANEELKVLNETVTESNEELKVLNETISEANEELTLLNETVTKKNLEIIDSISYAQTIQSAMLPPDTYLNELLDDVFILYKPRDIVSGDFYWIKQVNQYIILAAADCTGHGVPGAFMSILGISFLNEIVQRREITQANHVLNELRQQIKQSLRQYGKPEESKDGIDMALCVIDKKNKTLQYSGAYNPLYRIRELKGKPELTVFKADRMPLGYYQAKDRPFTNHDIELESGDTFYLFSDGYVDQMGGSDNKKFMSKNFKKLLLDIQDQSLFDQKAALEKNLSDWMGDNFQIDDILIVGMRV